MDSEAWFEYDFLARKKLKKTQQQMVFEGRAIAPTSWMAASTALKLEVRRTLSL